MPDTNAAQPQNQPGLFRQAVKPGGYAWWYVDGISADGRYALTLISFIGSVFSPYYAWSGRQRPLNHCALNIALYGPRHRRWAMTERGEADISLSENHFRIGPSHMEWNQNGLEIEISETGMPIPHRIRGRIRVRPRMLNRQVFALDPAQDHHWRPISPLADIEADFETPDLKWRGSGYLDMNYGRTPLEEAFAYWDWSRVHQRNGTTRISYTADTRSGAQVRHALRFSPDGACTHDEDFAPHEMAPTGIFRIRRRTSSGEKSSVQLGQTLEDTPFYSRSRIRSRIGSEWAEGVHESFDGNRLRSPVVKLMLPFRMPRRA